MKRVNEGQTLARGGAALVRRKALSIGVLAAAASALCFVGSPQASASEGKGKNTRSMRQGPLRTNCPVITTVIDEAESDGVWTAGLCALFCVGLLKTPACVAACAPFLHPDYP